MKIKRKPAYAHLAAIKFKEDIDVLIDALRYLIKKPPIGGFF
jgi:hypothetical protein